MTDSNILHAGLLIGELQQVLQFQPYNVKALCEIGRKLAQVGRAGDARKCYRAAVDALRDAARAGDVDRALQSEYAIYTAFVKTVEDDQHYYRCFSDWKDELAALGRRFRNPAALPETDANRYAFILQTGHMLGHTEVLLKMLESRPRTGAPHTEPRIYVLAKCAETFLQRCQSAGIEVVLLIDAMPNWHSTSWDGKFAWLRARFAQDRIGTCIWVTVPTIASFALSMGLAQVQIFWALRFHPITGSYIDGYITYGAKHEHERVFGKQKWLVCPVPLAIDTSVVEPKAKAELRARFPEKFLLGTIAREEKINSVPFLESVAKILKQNPAAGFVWTGKARHPEIERHFHDAGVLSRCHFVGWVDTRLYSSALDLFLETFPLGCGVTGYQALGAATPLLSFFAPNTVFGMQFWHEIAGKGDGGDATNSAQASNETLSKYPLLCAVDASDYVALANKVIADPDFRASASAAGKRFFDEEINNAGYYSKRFLDTIAAIAKAKFETMARSSTTS